MKLKCGILAFLSVFLLGSFVPLFTYAGVPDFISDFGNPLLDGDESGTDLGVRDDAILMDNLKLLFYPDSAGSGGGAIWRAIRTIAIGVLILLFIWAGARFVLYPDSEEELKKSWQNLLFLIYGAALILLVVWILGSALNIGSLTGIQGGQDSVVARAENNILLFVLTGLKAIAFFLAIIFIVYYGYQMVSAFDKEDKVKAATTGIKNVVIALVFIKVIDYLYFIAEQRTFVSDAIQLITDISKFLGYFGGMLIVIMLIYAGYLMVTSSGSEENFKRAANTIKSIFVVILMILLFLLIIYQVFNDIL